MWKTKIEFIHKPHLKCIREACCQSKSHEINFLNCKQVYTSK